jgi:hypothetical protein
VEVGKLSLDTSFARSSAVYKTSLFSSTNFAKTCIVLRIMKEIEHQKKIQGEGGSVYRSAGGEKVVNFYEEKLCFSSEKYTAAYNTNNMMFTVSFIARLKDYSI